MAMDQKQLKELGVELDVPFLKLLGVRCLRAELGEGEVVLSLKPEHQNSWEVAHGGVLLTLLDVGMAVAARASDEAGRGVVTIELKANFMQAAQGIVRVAAKTVHATPTMAFVEAKPDRQVSHSGKGCSKSGQRAQKNPPNKGLE